MMGFSAKQVAELRRDLNRVHVHQREIQGRMLSYIEGWHAIAEANRIFGFDAWDRETVETKCILGRESHGIYQAAYLARVRITVRTKAGPIVREGFGTGEADGSSIGAAHEKSLKTAETDATKRALATFGNPFGLSLYVSARQRGMHVSNPLPGAVPIPDHGRRITQQRIGRNGRYFVPLRSKAVLDPELLNRPSADSSVVQPMATEKIEGASSAPAKDDTGEAVSQPSAEGDPNGAPSEGSINPATAPQSEVSPTGLAAVEPQASASPLQPSTENRDDRARLMIDWPKRRRDPAHLDHVRAQPGLVCSRTPSDAHHLRFAQPRALGRKVSDEFTVPLCRVHHHQLHQSGKEVSWWSAMDRDVDPMEIAKTLWAESRQKLGLRDPQGNPDSTA